MFARIVAGFVQAAAGVAVRGRARRRPDCWSGRRKNTMHAWSPISPALPTAEDEEERDALPPLIGLLRLATRSPGRGFTFFLAKNSNVGGEALREEMQRH